MTAKSVTPALKPVPQIAMIVDLAIEHCPDGGRLVPERLIAFGRQVDDLQTRIDERGIRPASVPTRVRPTMA
jgi:hypothetical protein